MLFNSINSEHKDRIKINPSTLQKVVFLDNDELLTSD